MSVKDSTQFAEINYKLLVFYLKIKVDTNKLIYVMMAVVVQVASLQATIDKIKVAVGRIIEH